MWFYLSIVLLYIVNYTYGFNAIVVGGGPIGKLSAISLSRKGHNVKIYEKYGANKEIDIDKSLNFIIPKRGINVLDIFKVPYKDVSVTVNNIVRHTPTKTTVYQSPESISMSRKDLMESMDSVLNELGVETYESELIDGDFNKNTAEFSHGIEKFDLLLGADGDKSVTRRLMRLSNLENMSICSEIDNRSFKTLYITPEHIKSIPDYHTDWDNSFHVWQSSKCDLICPPTTSGGLSASFVSSDGGFNTDRFPSHFDYDRLDNQCPRVQRTVNPSHVGLGTVALVGDAAHTMLPSLGAGVTSGLEDCLVFDKCIQDGITPYEICELYNQRRILDSFAICNLSKMAFGKSDRSNRLGIVDENVIMSLGNPYVQYHHIERDIKYN